MYDLYRVFKTGILAVLTVTSGLGDSCIKGDDSCCVKILIIYCLMLYIIYVTLIMRLWDLYNLVAILVEFDMDSLLLFPPYFKGSVRLVINQSVWILQSGVNTQSLELSVRYLLSKVISFILCMLCNKHFDLVLPLICSYMCDLASKTNIWYNQVFRLLDKQAIFISF